MSFLALTTFELWEPGYSEADIQAECERYVARQNAIQACLDGRLDAGTVLDMLEAHTIDPAEYVEAVEENVAALISGQLPVGEES